MEAAAIALHRQGKTVVLRTVYWNKPTIRPRLNTLVETGVPVWYYKPWFVDAATSQLLLWRRHGGVLVSSDNGISEHHAPPVGPHDSEILAECPYSVELLQL